MPLVERRRRPPRQGSRWAKRRWQQGLPLTLSAWLVTAVCLQKLATTALLVALERHKYPGWVRRDLVRGAAARDKVDAAWRAGQVQMKYLTNEEFDLDHHEDFGELLPDGSDYDFIATLYLDILGKPVAYLSLIFVDPEDGKPLLVEAERNLMYLEDISRIQENLADHKNGLNLNLERMRAIDCWIRMNAEMNYPFLMDKEYYTYGARWTIFLAVATFKFRLLLLLYAILPAFDMTIQLILEAEMMEDVLDRTEDLFFSYFRSLANLQWYEHAEFMVQGCQHWAPNRSDLDKRTCSLWVAYHKVEMALLLLACFWHWYMEKLLAIPTLPSLPSLRYPRILLRGLAKAAKAKLNKMQAPKDTRTPEEVWLDACRAGQTGPLRTILSSNPKFDVNVRSRSDGRDTGLLLGCRFNCLSVVQFLLDHNRSSKDLDLSAKDKAGKTALELAAGEGFKSVVNRLTREGAPAMSNAKEAVREAVNNNHFDIGDLILSKMEATKMDYNFRARKHLDSCGLLSKELSKKGLAVANRNTVKEKLAQYKELFLVEYSQEKTQTKTVPAVGGSRALEELLEMMDCDICFDSMEGQKIYACSNDHWVCESCIPKTFCPTCKEDFREALPRRCYRVEAASVLVKTAKEDFKKMMEATKK